MKEDPKNVLKRAFDADREIKMLKEEREQLRERMEYVHAIDYSNPVVTSSGGRGSVEALTTKLADADGKILEQINRLIEDKRAANEMISVLRKGPQREVMYQRYVLLKSWEQIALDMGYSYRHITRLHGAALEELRKRCPFMS